MDARWAQLGIEHVVVLMLENRSFDQMLGSFPWANQDEPIDGVTSGMSNQSSRGPIKVWRITNPAVYPSPDHHFRSVQRQIAGGAMSGFVTEYETVDDVGFYPGQADPAQVMGYYESTAADPGSAGWLQYLANAYGVSDRWFCSLPADTWPNRFFAHAATSGGHVGNDIAYYEMETIYDRLDHPETTLPSAPRPWANYCDFVPQLICIARYGMDWWDNRHQSDSRFRSLRQFQKDCEADALPTYSFIEPRYAFGADDGHPPHDLGAADRLIGQIYAAVRQSPAWDKTLLVISFDEHGGFFDHCYPPPAPAPEPLTGRPFAPLASDEQNPSFEFKALGPRVPCVVISSRIGPCARIRPADGRFFDHTSVLATVERLFGLMPLTRRDEGADDLLSVISPTLRADAPDVEDGPPIRHPLRDEDGGQPETSEPDAEADAVLADTIGMSGAEVTALWLALPEEDLAELTDLAISLRAQCRLLSTQAANRGPRPTDVPE